MLVRLRASTPEEKWLSRCDLMWQPEGRREKWYALRWQNIEHENREHRCNVVNMCFKHRLPIICRASYDRTRHVLKILLPKEANS